MKRIILFSIYLLLFSFIVYLMIPSTLFNHRSRQVDLLPVKTSVYDTLVTGVVIINTGTPATLTKKDVRLFIGDMLSDPYVMGLPPWVGRILARKIIAPMRASSSLEKYSLIWGSADQSPLFLNTAELGNSVETALSAPVEVAMRYGEPSIDRAVAELKRRCPSLNRVVLLPLFPQYAESSYRTAVEAVRQNQEFASGRCVLETIDPYYNNQAYIEALADRIEAELNDRNDFHIVFSYHSLPLSHIEEGKARGEKYDYEYQCRETARLTARQLGVSDYSVVYASAIGERWLGPMLDDVMAELPSRGVRKIAVVAPGFIIDNLETLYDIDVNARKIFIDNGGESFLFVPCLNVDFASTASQLILPKL